MKLKNEIIIAFTTLLLLGTLYCMDKGGAAMIRGNKMEENLWRRRCVIYALGCLATFRAVQMFL